MSKKTSINVESVPLTSVDERGNYVSGSMSGVLFEAKTMVVEDPLTGETREIQTIVPKRAEQIIHSHKAPEDDAYLRIKSLQPVEGSILKFRLQDSPNQSAPGMLPIGEFTLLKDYDFKLAYTDEPIEMSTTGIPSNLEYAGKMCSPYPTNKFKTQKELLWYIINRRAFFSNFIWHELVHPPELQKTLQAKSLLEQKRKLAEEKEQKDKEYLRQTKQIEKELRNMGITNTSKDLKSGEEKTETES